MLAWIVDFIEIYTLFLIGSEPAFRTTYEVDSWQETVIGRPIDWSKLFRHLKLRSVHTLTVVCNIKYDEVWFSIKYASLCSSFSNTYLTFIDRSKKSSIIILASPYHVDTRIAFYWGSWVTILKAIPCKVWKMWVKNGIFVVFTS